MLAQIMFSAIGKGFQEFVSAAFTCKGKTLKDDQDEGLEIIEMEEGKILEHSASTLNDSKGNYE